MRWLTYQTWPVAPLQHTDAVMRFYRLIRCRGLGTVVVTLYTQHVCHLRIYRGRWCYRVTWQGTWRNGFLMNRVRV